jgi:GAF domain-containing protein
MQRSRTINSFGSIYDMRSALQVDNDWELQNYDAETSLEQTLEDEFKRLLVLKSYSILDTEPEMEFEETTRHAKEIFNVPVSAVSLVDMGRQWFKSIQGLEVSETPRNWAFCSHVVQRKASAGVMVVPDATQDVRFKDNPLVTHGPKFRFYAGAPLISPEKKVLGTVCIFDDKPWPTGLNKKQTQQLQQLAHETVGNLILR